MKYVIGIDGGGTKTKLMLSDLNGAILETAISGPTNILSSGLTTARESLVQLIKEGVLERGYDLHDCVALCVGVAGGSRDSIKVQIEEIIRASGYEGKLLITHDADIALVAGVNGEHGVLIVAGTGTICYGRTKEGKNHRVSGWGHILGDEGSAYQISIEILNAVMRQYDGRGEETILTPLVLEYLKIDTPDEIINAIYQPDIKKQHIAKLAILIEKGCQQEDKVAMAIVEETIESLYECVDTCIKKLDITDKAIKIVLNGSVLLNNSYINAGVVSKIAKNYPLAEICKMKKDSAYGATLLAIQSIVENEV